MEPLVFFAVLAGAAMHATWNAFIKTGLDRFLSLSLVSTGAGLIALALIPVLGTPVAAAWPYLVASVIIHIGYKAFLIQAYSRGDMAQVYPIARGAPPLVVAGLGAWLLGEHLSPAGSLGIAVLTLGVMAMSLRGGRALAHVDRRTVTYALLTAACIVAYTLVDGRGSRINGSPHVYAVWFFMLDALVGFAAVPLLRGRAGLAALRTHWRMGLAGGVMMLASYWIALWAMSRAPIAVVAALRETGMLFAALIATFWLREPLTGWRITSIVAIVAGAMLIRLN